MSLSTARTTATSHLRRLVAVVVLSSVALAPAPSAAAAGTGGIEVTPSPAVRDGRPVTVFEVDVPSRGRQVVPFTVRNVADGPRSATLSVAQLSEDDGSFAIVESEPSPYVQMDERVVALEPGEVEQGSFVVEAPSGQPLEDDAYAAVVVTVQDGSVVTRASTVIYLEPGRRVPLPLLLVVAAVVLVALSAAGWAAYVRRARSRAA